jgi:hypothetical protein
MQLRIVLVLAAFVAASAMNIKGTKNKDGKVVSKVTRVSDVTVDTSKDIAGKAVDIDRMKGEAIKGKQEEGVEKLEKKAGAVKAGMSTDSIMAAIKKKTTDKKLWASRKTQLTKEKSEVTDVTTTVDISKNPIADKAFDIEKTSVFYGTEKGKYKDAGEDGENFNRMAVSMQRKVADFAALSNSIKSYADHFYPEVATAVEQVRLQTAHLKAQEGKAKATTSSEKKLGVRTEDSIEDQLISEDYQQLQLLLQAHNDLTASVAAGKKEVDAIFAKIGTENKKMYEHTDFLDEAAEPITQWSADFKKAASLINVDIETCPTEKKRKRRVFVDDSVAATVDTGAQITQSARTVKHVEVLAGSTADTMKDVNILKNTEYGAGDARFKATKDPLIERIKADMKHMRQDRKEIRRLAREAYQPRGLRGQQAFIETSGSEGKVNKITTKARGNDAAGFTKKGDAVGTKNEMGQNKIASGILDKQAGSKQGNVDGSKTQIGNTKTTVKTDAVAGVDVSKIDVTTILRDLNEKKYPRQQNTQEEVSGAASSLNGGFKSAAAQLVDAHVKTGKKQMTQPEILKEAIKISKVDSMDKVVALVDKRLVWLRDAMKEMTKYYIWAKGEMKRGATVKTVTNVKAYEQIIKKEEENFSINEHDKTEILAKIIEAMKNVQQNIAAVRGQFQRFQGYLLEATTAAETLTGAKEAITTSCATVTAQKTKMLADLDLKPGCKNEAKIKTDIDALVAMCATSKTGSLFSKFEKVVTAFTTTKTTLWSLIREAYSVMASVLGAFEQYSNN